MQTVHQQGPAVGAEVGGERARRQRHHAHQHADGQFVVQLDGHLDEGRAQRLDPAQGQPRHLEVGHQHVAYHHQQEAQQLERAPTYRPLDQQRLEAERNRPAEEAAQQPLAEGERIHQQQPDDQQQQAFGGMGQESTHHAPASARIARYRFRSCSCAALAWA
ncbi:hypothetical protein D3C84_930330 [compost metagenome]